MVYCGKPSRGCQMCRTRRIKCDETKPTCNQCAKSRRVCPGYKDEFDLVFRNETQATERRARKANQKAIALKLSRDVDPAEDSTIVDNTAKKGTSPAAAWRMVFGEPKRTSYVVSTLQLPPEQHASCHFVSNFVLIPRQGSTRGYMEHLIPLLKADRPSEHFKNAFEACAFASLGNRVGPGNDFDQVALSKYTKALASTYKALRHPELAKQDETLAAILLLGLFENISAKQLGMLAWGSHIEGAIQLVKARGKQQTKTTTGLLLFIAVRTQMIIHTLTSGKPPIMGVEWWIDDAVNDHDAAACQRLSIRVGELRAEVNRLLATLVPSPETIELILDLMRRCQAVDQDCVAWARDLPSLFDFSTVAWEEDDVQDGDYSKAEVFPGRVDAYQDLWVASVWNLMRTSRIILASLTVRCAAWICAPTDYRTTPEFATAARTCVESITDIIASVPYQLGYFVRRKHLLRQANLSAFGCGDEDANKGLPGYFLTWPLTCVVGQDYATEAQRAWCNGRLNYIGNQLGVRYAHMLTKLNLRVPSMLIRANGLMAQPLPSGPDFEKLLSGRSTKPAEQLKREKDVTLSAGSRAPSKPDLSMDAGLAKGVHTGLWSPLSPHHVTQM